MTPTNHGSTAGGVHLSRFSAGSSGAFVVNFDSHLTFGSMAGGMNLPLSGSDAILIDHPIYIDAPPATHGVGDWVMRLVAQELNPSTIPAGVEIIEDIYVVPLGSETTVRYWEIANYSGGARDVSLWMAGYPIYTETIEDGRRIIGPEGFSFVMGEGETIKGKIDSDVDGVWMFASGVETVTS